MIKLFVCAFLSLFKYEDSYKIGTVISVFSVPRMKLKQGQQAVYKQIKLYFLFIPNNNINKTVIWNIYSEGKE